MSERTKGREDQDGPGTPKWRLEYLARFTQEEFGHDPVSGGLFETSLIPGIRGLKESLNKARAEVAAVEQAREILGDLVQFRTVSGARMRTALAALDAARGSK